MRRSAVAWLMTAVLVLGSVTASRAQPRGAHGGGSPGARRAPPAATHGARPGRHYDHSGPRGRVVIGVGPTWWGPLYPFDPYPWPYPYPYLRPYPYPPYYGYPGPPVVVQEEPPVYVERPPPAAPEAYWYYCPSARAYYPDVKQCPESWIKVPPAPKEE